MINKPYLIDAHAHLNFNAFDVDRDEVINRTLAKNIWHVNVGTQAKTAATAVSLAEKYQEGVYAIIGLHPIHTSQSFHDEAELGEGGIEFTSTGEQFDFDFYKKLAQSDKVVGIGECGLDYFRSSVEQKEIQVNNFVRQIELANSVQKPLMLHIRQGMGDESIKAYTDAGDILKRESKVLGNVHFFAGSVTEAKIFLDMGFYLSFTGVITFAKNYEELVKFIPLDRILIETDCPYVAPAPFRGARNEPLYVEEVAKKVALIKGLSLEGVASQTVANWFQLFGSSLSL